MCITTVYNPQNTIIRSRKIPGTTTIIASITRPIFGDSLGKDLPIPTPIDAYSHYIGKTETISKSKLIKT